MKRIRCVCVCVCGTPNYARSKRDTISLLRARPSFTSRVSVRSLCGLGCELFVILFALSYDCSHVSNTPPTLADQLRGWSRAACMFTPPYPIHPCRICTILTQEPIPFCERSRASFFAWSIVLDESVRYEGTDASKGTRRKDNLKYTHTKHTYTHARAYVQPVGWCTCSIVDR